MIYVGLEEYENMLLPQRTGVQFPELTQIAHNHMCLQLQGHLVLYRQVYSHT